MPPSTPRLLAAVGFALLAFAANSLFCRLALGRGDIDAATFTFVRLAAGTAILLIPFAVDRPPDRNVVRPNLLSAAMLFAYAAAFSLAYRQLSAGTGALLLFGAVQLTMLGAALWRGERPRHSEWLGLGVALAGLIYLVSPGVTAPAPLGSALMVGAGIAWGIYTLRGRGQGKPLVVTAANFLWATPLGLLFWLAQPVSRHVSELGLLWAILSGALSSGLGYAAWYYAVPALTATRAATVQLTVPVIAAFGGIVVLRETLTARLVFASVLVLGGVGLAITARGRPASISRS